MNTKLVLIPLTAGLCLTATLTLTSTVSAAPVGLKLGINSSGNLQNSATGHLLPTDLAGATGYAQTNWNNCGRYGGPLVPIDENGTNSGLSIQWDCTGIWSEQGGGTPTAQAVADSKLMNSYDDSNGSANTVPNDGTITTGVSIFGSSGNNKPWMYVTNLSAWLAGQGACSYDVVVYAEGDTSGRIGQYWIEQAVGPGGNMTVGPNLTPSIFVDSETGFINSPGYTQVPTTSNTGAAAASGNYAVFPGLTADSILIRTEEYRPPGGTLRSPINAIQIVPNTQAVPTFQYPTPAPQTNYGGTKASFLLPASGCGISYQWMAGAVGSGVYTNLTDGGNLWGSLTPLLTITNLVPTQTADYVLVATSGAGSVQSAPMTLVVQPQIITGPFAQEILYPKMTAHFVTTVGATGATNYQWYKDSVALTDGTSGSGAAISGSLTPNLTVTGVGAADVGNYWLVTSNAYGTTTSVVSSLTLLPTPTPGSFAESVVTNSPLAYWRFDETSGTVAFDNAGGLNGSYGLNATVGQPGMQSAAYPGYPGFDSTNGAFGVSLTDNSWVTIPALNLNTNTVTFVAWVYLNNNQANWAGIITSRHNGTQAGFNFSGQSGKQNELSYTWDENTAATYNANVEVYVTNSVWTMVALVVTPTNAAFYACDPAGGIRSATYAYPNNAELFYGPGTIGVDDTWGAVRAMYGQIDEVAVFSHALSPTAITWLYVAGTAAGAVPPPTIAVQPLTQELYPGRPATFSVVPAGLPPFTYQWRSNGIPLVDGGRISGSTNATLVIANTQLGDAATYDVVVANNGGPVTSLPATLSFVSPTGAAYESAVMGSGPVAYWRLNEPGGSTYAFDYFGGFTATYGSAASLGAAGPVPTEFPGFETTNTGTTFAADVGGSEVTAPPLNLNTNTVTIAAWINPATDQITNYVGLVFQRQNLTLSGLSYGGSSSHLGYNWNNQAADYNWDSGLTVPVGQWSLAALVIEPSRATLYVYNSSNQLVAAHSAPHAVQAFDGNTHIGTDPFYDNGVRNFNGTMDEVSIWNRALSGDQIAALYTAASGVSIPPSVALQPVSTTIYVGKTNQLVMTAAGSGPYSFQWYTNGVPLADGGDIVGSTSSVLSFTSAALADANSYYCVVSTTLGRATSAVATVTVLPAAAAPVFTVSANNGATYLNLTNQAGVVVGAEDFGATEYSFNVTNGTIATYDFKVDGSVASVTGNGTLTGTLFGTGTFGFTTGNTNLDSVLNECSDDGGPKTLTINGLVPGRSYAVQMFALDDRDSSGGQHREQSRRAYFQDPFNSANVSSTFYMSNNVYVKATFTAASTSQVLIEQLPGWPNGFTDVGDGNLNALVVRDTTPTPAIVQQPASTTRYQGFPVTFTATGYGQAPTWYQWQKGSGGVFANLTNNGTVPNPALTTFTLTLPAVSSADAADYRLVLTNSSGSITSQVATLTVLPLPGGGSYESALLSYGPLAYWQLDETSGSLVARDYAGGFDGTYLPFATNGLPGVPTPPFAGFPVNNHAVQTTLNQTNSWVSVPALNFNTNTVTFTAWVYPYSTPDISTQADWAGIFMTRSGIAAGIGFGGAGQTNANMLSYTWNGNSGATWGFVSGLSIPSNEWSFVAVAISPTNAALYLMNAEGSQSTNNPIAHTSQNWNGPATIGDDPNGNQATTRAFNGLVDEVAVFTRTLSPADLANVYHAVPLALPTTPTGLAALAGDGQVSLSWNGQAETDSYNIKRSTTSGSGYTVVANVAGTSFVNTNVSNGTQYYFVVSAVNRAGESSNSAEVGARPTSSTPPQVGVAISGQQVQLTWPADHTGWLLQAQTNSAGVGLSTNWVTLPNSGTGDTWSVPVDSAKGSVFFRLVHP